jgi:hypothetical protein
MEIQRFESETEECEIPQKRAMEDTHDAMVVCKVPKTSQYRGVSKSGSLWQSRFTSRGITHQIGRYDTELEAHIAYENFVIENEKNEKCAEYAEKLFHLVTDSVHIPSDAKVKLLKYLFTMKNTPRNEEAFAMICCLHSNGFENSPMFHKALRLLL